MTASSPRRPATGPPTLINPTTSERTDRSRPYFGAGALWARSLHPSIYQTAMFFFTAVGGSTDPAVIHFFRAVTTAQWATEYENCHIRSVRPPKRGIINPSTMSPSFFKGGRVVW